MKIKNLIRNPSVFLMAVLIFSFPFMTTRIEAEDAKSDAKKDAENIKELKKELRWFVIGCLGGALPFIPVYFATEDNIITCSFLPGVGTLLPTAYAMLHSPVPPVERLLGNPLITSGIIPMLIEIM